MKNPVIDPALPTVDAGGTNAPLAMGDGPSSAPPHPFRSAPWYDPTEEHQPCQCPNCRAARTVKRKGSPALRVGAVVMGGVVLPLVSVAVNSSMGVVDLGAGGVVWIVLSVLSALAHLFLSPVRRDPDTKELIHRPPRSTALKLALLSGSLSSAVLWVYFALLFLPLVPLSFIALAFFGLGLCGLCPFGAAAVALFEAVRDVRALGLTWRRPAVIAATVTLALGPVVACAGVVAHRHLARRQLDLALTKIGLQDRYSEQRMRLIAGLKGQQERVLEAYLDTTDTERHRRLAEVYLRLTEKSLAGEVQKRLSTRRNAVINPWWFAGGGDPLNDHWLRRL